MAVRQTVQGVPEFGLKRGAVLRADLGEVAWSAQARMYIGLDIRIPRQYARICGEHAITLGVKDRSAPGTKGVGYQLLGAVLRMDKAPGIGHDVKGVIKAEPPSKRRCGDPRWQHRLRGLPNAERGARNAEGAGGARVRAPLADPAIHQRGDARGVGGGACRRWNAERGTRNPQ
jgi:hypothetical protein